MVSNTPNYAVIIVSPVTIDYEAIVNQKKYPADMTKVVNGRAEVILMNLR